MFNSEDLRQIAAHGLSVESVEQQIENFKRGFPFLKVVRAASVGDGVRALGGEELSRATMRYDAESATLKVVKFLEITLPSLSFSSEAVIVR